MIGVVAVPFVWAGVGEFRLAFSAEPDGVDFRNHFAQQHFDWNEVVEFRTQRRRAGFNSLISKGQSGSVIVVVTHDREERTTAVAASFVGPEHGRGQQSRLDQLNAMRRRYATRES